MKRNFKGQSSVEFLSVVAIALLVLIPGSYLFLNYTQGATEQVASNQLNLFGREIISEAEKMYVVGRDSWVTIELSLPGNFIEGGIRDGKEMYFKYGSNVGESYVVFFPVGFDISDSRAAACVGDCPFDFVAGGVNRIRIQSQGDFVSIERVT